MSKNLRWLDIKYILLQFFQKQRSFVGLTFCLDINNKLLNAPLEEFLQTWSYNNERIEQPTSIPFLWS